LTVQQAQSAQVVDTKAQIALFFKQSIDSILLEVTAFETAFDKTWLTQDAQGTEFFKAKGHQLVDLQRDHQITKVGGKLACTKVGVNLSRLSEKHYYLRVLNIVNI
jgi:hypothetical protein